MSDQEQEVPAEVGEEASEEPDRNFPISENARFTIGGKPLVLDDFIDITTGDRRQSAKSGTAASA